MNTNQAIAVIWKVWEVSMVCEVLGWLSFVVIPVAAFLLCWRKRVGSPELLHLDDERIYP